MPIWFHSEDVNQPILQKRVVKQWVEQLLTQEHYTVGDINYIFCSDEYLLEVNKEHLQHDYYTDIITFHYSETNEIHTDMFISVDRVMDNAKTENSQIEEELVRVMAHGILHQIGWNDKTDDEAKEMRKAEQSAIQLFHTILSNQSITSVIKLK